MVNRMASLLVALEERRGDRTEPATMETYERIGRAVSEFIEARRRGEYVSAEEHILQLLETEQDLARRCFETAEFFLAWE